MAEKLKPCPFCGGEANLKDASGFIVAKCESCGAESGMVKISAEYCANDKVAERWNTRVAPHHNANTETCVCCGAEIPEGRQVCPACENGEDK